MGGSSSKKFYAVGDGEEDKDYELFHEQRQIQKKIKIPLQVMVSHYTPSSFPLLPTINRENTDLCRESWKTIISTEVADPYGGQAVGGMTAFYTEFYDR